MVDITQFIKSKHNLNKYLARLESNGEVDITNLDVKERVKLIAMARRKGYVLGYKYPNQKDHEYTILYIKENIKEKGNSQ